MFTYDKVVAYFDTGRSVEQVHPCSDANVHDVLLFAIKRSIVVGIVDGSPKILHDVAVSRDADTMERALEALACLEAVEGIDEGMGQSE